MSSEIRVPTLPESVTDAMVLTWHKKIGDTIARDENLVDLETDKVVLEVPSPIEGVLTKITADEGSVVSSDDILGSVEIDNKQSKAATTEVEKMVAAAPRNTKNKKLQHSNDAADVLTPAVRRLVKELSLDATKIQGSGKDGRILKSDVMSYLDTQKKDDHMDIAASIPNQNIRPTQRNETRVPMTRLRARVAERLIEAQQNAAILTTFNEIDLNNVIKLRDQYKEAFQQSHNSKLGFMSFFVKATIDALKKFPVVNASIDGTDIIYHSFHDIGIAVGSPRGLVVPIVRDADQLSFAEIEQTISQYSQKAQDGSLSYDELSGGTFTISNGGVYGSMLSTPILNPPQSAILGMHNIVKRPVVVDDEIVIRPMMYLALSYDHRIIDGKEAVQFLTCIKQNLEQPSRLLLQI